MKRKSTTMRRTRFGRKYYAMPPVKNIPEVQDMKELVYAHEYLADLDPVGAALRTGMVSMRLLPNEQQFQAIKIFHRASVQKHIKKAMQDRLLKIGITEDRVLGELANMAFINITDLQDANGDFKDIRSLPRGISCVIQEMEYKVLYETKKGKRIPKGHITKVKLCDKLSSLKTLLSHIAGKSDDKLNINYNQFNIGNQVNSNNTTNNTFQQIDMSDFTDMELKVIRKMSGNQDPMALIELQKIESQYYESSLA